MVRQGGYKLRFHGQLRLVVASFLTLALASSIAGPLYAESVDTTAPTSQGFNRTSSYYSQVTTLHYLTAPNVEKVQFALYDTDAPEDLTADRVGTLTAEDVSTTDDEYKIWKVSEAPSKGVMLMTQVQQGDEPWEYVETDTVAIAPPPTLTLSPYEGQKGGSTLSVKGKLEGVAFGGLKLTARLLTPERGELSSVSATRSGDDVSASLPLPSDLEGKYFVEMSLTHEGMKITDTDDESVSLMTHKPVVETRISQDPPYANEAFEIYATPTSKTTIASVTLSYADQTAEMTAREDGSYIYGFPLGLPSATYDFKVVARDALGNTNHLSPATLQKFFLLRVVTSPEDDKGLLPILPRKPTAALSTDFAPLLVPRVRVSDPKGEQDDTDRAFVLGAETEKLKDVVDLNDTSDEVDAPLDTSSAGWKMLGVPWYLWLTGGATAWGGAFAARWWFRRG